MSFSVRSDYGTFSSSILQFFLFLLIPGSLFFCCFKIYTGLMGNPGGIAEWGGGEVLRRTGSCSC